MKQLFLARGGSSRLIVFFAGWGMDERPFLHLKADDADVLLCYDYTLPEDAGRFEEVFPAYERVLLAAWSLGVWAAAETFGNTAVRFEDALAINGTLMPLDAEHGIPPMVFERTADRWSETTRPRFYRRMCRDTRTLECFLKAPPLRSIESQREELLAVRRRVAVADMAESGLFRRAFIGAEDRIFPPHAQRRFWKNHGVEIVESAAPHYAFANLKTFNEIFAVS